MKNSIYPTLILRSVLGACALVSASASAIETDFEVDHSLPLVHLNVVVKGGSVNDPAGQSGVSQFTADMLLRGTRLRNKEALNQALDQIGASLEVEARAEAVIVHGAVLKAQLPAFLDLMEEVVTQPAFAEEEIHKLKNQTTSEILDELGSDQRLASRFFQRFLFGKHPYGAPVNGTKKEIEKLTQAQVRAQYDHLFRSEQMLVIGSGDSDRGTIQAWADRLAEKRPGSAVIAKTSQPEFPTQRRLQIIDKPDRTQTQVYIGLPGVKMTNPHFFALYLANTTFGGGSFQARLMSEVRAKRGWAYGAYSNYRFGRQPRSWIAYTFPATKDTAPAVSLVLKMMDDMRATGLTNDEFAFNQNAQIASAAFMYNTPKKRIDNMVLEKTLDLPAGFMKSYASEIAKLTKADVDAAAKSFFDSSQVTISVLGTAAKIQSDVASAAGMKAAQVQVVDYRNE